MFVCRLCIFLIDRYIMCLVKRFRKECNILVIDCLYLSTYYFVVPSQTISSINSHFFKEWDWQKNSDHSEKNVRAQTVCDRIRNRLTKKNMSVKYNFQVLKKIYFWVCPVLLNLFFFHVVVSDYWFDHGSFPGWLLRTWWTCWSSAKISTDVVKVTEDIWRYNFYFFLSWLSFRQI